MLHGHPWHSPRMEERPETMVIWPETVQLMVFLPEDLIAKNTAQTSKY